MRLKINWDGLGIITSIACAIHCAILPMAAASLPLLGIDIIHNGLFEWSMIGIAFFIGSYALLHGYRSHHRSLKPMMIFSLGFAFLLTKQFFHARELYFLIPAVLLIIGAHFYNYRLGPGLRHVRKQVQDEFEAE